MEGGERLPKLVFQTEQPWLCYNYVRNHPKHQQIARLRIDYVLVKAVKSVEE
jgi:hypothetical protein